MHYVRVRGLLRTLGAVCLVLLLGCDRSGTAGGTGRQKELPERGILVTRREYQEALLEVAHKHLEEMAEPLAAYYDEWTLITGNWLAASTRLQKQRYREDRAPLALFGSHGLDPEGQQYVNLTVLNEHRETSALWLMIHRRDFPLLRVRVAFNIHEKAPGLMRPHWFTIVPQSWDGLDAAERVASDVLEVRVGPGRVVEMPSIAGCTISAAAEDRINGLGNFVLLFEKDIGRPPSP